jgi:putative nucleotidyltransferase with HDIG domain
MNVTADSVRTQTPWALRQVPPFPSVAQRIMALAGQENSSPQEVGHLVTIDPSFSAELLRFANSALFGPQRPVSGLAHAIALLGMDRVKVMAALVVVNRMVRASLRIEALRKVWMHSLATALIAEEAAVRMGVGREDAYAAGLLHHVGALGMMSAYPDEYSRMLEVSNDFGFDILRTERDLFEIDHCAAGAYLAQDWNFPNELAAAIATHHDDIGPGQNRLESLLGISWRLADALGFAAFSPAREWTYKELMTYMPGTARRTWLGHDVEEAHAELTLRLTDAAA